MADPTNKPTPAPAEGRAIDPNAKPTEQILTTKSRPEFARDKVEPKWLRFYDALIRQRDTLLDSHSENYDRARENTAKAVIRDPAAVGTEEFHRQRSFSMQSFETTTLAEVERALARIADGTYGICEITGAPIPEERLEAMPWTRYSVEGQERAEREGTAVEPMIGSERAGRPVEDTVTSWQDETRRTGDHQPIDE